jgi:hypothetical protein
MMAFAANAGQLCRAATPALRVSCSGTNHTGSPTIKQSGLLGRFSASASPFQERGQRPGNSDEQIDTDRVAEPVSSKSASNSIEGNLAALAESKKNLQL